MRLINSFLSKEAFIESETMAIKKAFENNYEEKIELQSFKYDDREFFELDVDILDIEFSKENLEVQLRKLIRIHDELLAKLNKEIFIIIANDDTDSEIILFEEDSNSTKNIGMLISKKQIGTDEPYFKADNCVIYLDFKYVSFDVIY